MSASDRKAAANKARHYRPSADEICAMFSKRWSLSEVILLSRWRLSAREQPSFPDILIV